MKSISYRCPSNKLRIPRTLLFDLDDTLYPKSVGLLKTVSERIVAYIEMRLKLSHGDANEMRIKYRDAFGSSLVGLYHIEKIDPVAYEKYVYDIDYAFYLSPDYELAEVIGSLPQEKIVFTNAAEGHASAVIKHLGLERYIDKIVSIEKLFYYAKPMPQSFREMFRVTGINASETIFFDDQVSNLIAAQRFNMRTALVSEEISLSARLKELAAILC